MKYFTKCTDMQATIRRRKRLVRGTSVALCLAMGLSIAGCGKSKKDDVKTIAADAAYFSVEDLDFYKGSEGDESNLISVVPVGDKIAMLISVYNYSNMPADQGLYSSGGAVVAETVAAEAMSNTVEDKETATSESSQDETTAAGDATDTSDAADTTDTTAPDAAAEETVIGDDMEITDGTAGMDDYVAPQVKYIVLFYDNEGKLTSQTDLSDTFTVNDSVMNMACDAEGNMVILTQSYDQVTYESAYLLYSLDTDGKQIGEPIPLTFEANTYPNQMAIDKAGNMYFSGYGDQGATITVLDSKGKPLFDISNGTENLNGTMYLIGDTMYSDGYQIDNDNYKYVFYPIDAAAKKLGEPIDMTTLSAMGGSGFYVGTDGLYSSDTIGVYKIDMETNTKTPVMKWNETDLENSMNGSQKIIVFSSDKIMVMSTTYLNAGTETKVSMLNREATNPNAGKKIITIAGVGITYNSDVLTSVYNFNTTNTEYRVEIKDYMADQAVSSEDDYNKILNTMNMEILSGDGPDIIYGSYQSFENYEAKGLLTDLYSVMEKDTSFKKDDYIPSIFKLCETDGHLYLIGTSFVIQGFVGSKDLIGDRMGWNVSEFNDMVSSLPSGVKPLANQTQTSLLTSSLYASMDAFVNNTKSEVTFDTPAFYELLDYAKTYGTDDDIKDGEYVDEQTMLQNGELALSNCYISDPSSYAQYVTMLGGPVSVTGYPSSDKRGPMCYMNTMLAISSSSGSQTAAWDFVKSFLSEEAQTKVAENYQIPVLTSAFEAQIKKAMNPDENNGGMIVYDKMGNVTPMTEETAQAYRDLVNGLDTLASYDQEIISIILEEVPEYFNNQKTDKDVAALVQDRVQTLVNERQ